MVMNILYKCIILKPVHTFNGTGTLKKVCYVCPTPAYFNPNYYAFTEYATLYGMGPDICY